MKNIRKLIILSVIICACYFWRGTVKDKLFSDAATVSVIKPADIVFVVDRSSSMGNLADPSDPASAISKLDAVKSAVAEPSPASSFINTMAAFPPSGPYEGQYHKLGLVAFNNTVDIAYLTSDFSQIRTKVIGSETDAGYLSMASGYRNTALGIRNASTQLENADYSADKVMIIVTDGLPSYATSGSDPTAIADAENEVRNAIANNIRVIVVGINMGSSQETDFTNYLKAASSSAGDCFYVNKFYSDNPDEQLENCNSVTSTDLSATLNEVYNTVTASMFDDNPPSVDVGISPNGSLFEGDSLTISANAVDDVGIFKNFYILWAKNCSDWSSCVKNRVDCSNLAGIVGDDGQRRVFINTTIPETLNNGDAIKYQVIATDAGNNVTILDPGGPRTLTVASTSISFNPLRRNIGNAINLNIGDPNGSYSVNTFRIFITSPDNVSLGSTGDMTQSSNNGSSAQYYYNFNPGCDWTNGLYQNGEDSQTANNIRINISVQARSSDTDWREIALSNDASNVLTSFSEGMIWAGTCSDAPINNDCDYTLSGNPIIDSAELLCDADNPGVTMTRTNPDESSQVNENTNSVTFNIQAWDDSGVQRVNVFYNRNGGAPVAAFTCTNMNDGTGRCVEDPARNITNFSVTVGGPTFPATPGDVINYYAQAIDNSGNDNQTTSTIGVFTVQSSECYDRADLDSCGTGGTGRCCAGVCNASISNPSGFVDIACTQEVCNGTSWQLAAGNNGAVCTTDGGEEAGCFATTPAVAPTPFDIPSGTYSTIPYSSNGCENRSYACNNGTCAFAANGGQNDGCAGGGLLYHDYECSTENICAERSSWDDSLCDVQMDFANLWATDSAGVNFTGRPEILDNRTNPITLNASVGDDNGIRDYRIYWQINDGVWQYQDCGGSTVENPCSQVNPCTCSQTITNGGGQFSQGDFISYYLWTEDNSPNHNARITAANGLNYKYYNSTDLNPGSLVSAGVDSAVNYDWGGGVVRINPSSLPESNYDNVSISWEGFVVPAATGTHTFYVTTDDSMHLYLNNSMVLDRWWAQGPTEYSYDYTFNSMNPVPVKIEWNEYGGGAVLQLGWAVPGGARTYPIQAANLVAPYVVAVRSSDCYSIDPNYNPAVPSTASQNISSRCNSGAGICCNGYCDSTPPVSSIFSSECQVDSCDGINWSYAASTTNPFQNNDGNVCGAAGTCFAYYNGCNSGNICSGGMCVPDASNIKTDTCTDSAGNSFVSGDYSSYHFLTQYGCSDGTCSAVSSNIDCSQASSGACACDCGGYSSSIGKEKVYSSLKMNGANSYVFVPSLTWAPTAFSVGFWLYPMSCANWNQILMGANDWGTFEFHSTAGCSAYVGTDVNNRFTPGEIPYDTLTLNQWQYFVFTFDNGSGKFYKNGTLIASKTGMFNSNNWGGFYIGVPDSNTINGYVDEVRIYDRALYPEEVKDQYKGIYDNNSGGLVGYWSMDEGSGGKVADNSGNGNDGYLSGGAMFKAGDGVNFPAWTTDRLGNSNKAISLYGSQYMNLSSASSFGGGTNAQGSVEFWFKANDTTYWQYMWVYDRYDNPELLVLMNGDTINFSGYQSGTYQWRISAPFMDTASWHHLVGTFANNNAVLYLDGIRVGSDSSCTITDNGPIFHQLGSYSRDMRYFNGYVDEMRTYSRALSSEEIAQHYQGNYIDDTGLTGYWNFNEGAGIYANNVAKNAASQSPQWSKYFYSSSPSVMNSIANNVPLPWRVCTDAIDNDCNGTVGGDSSNAELACDGQLDGVDLVFTNTDDSDDLLDYTDFAELKDRDVRDPAKNFTMDASFYDESGLQKVTTQWSTDNWNTTHTLSCSQTDDGHCRACTAGAACTNTDSGVVSGSDSNGITNDNSFNYKLWITNEWAGGTLEITEGGATRQFAISGNTQDAIAVSGGWGTEGQPSAGATYRVIKSGATINPNALVAGAVLRVKTCAYDRSTNNNSGCTSEKVISIINSNNPPTLNNLLVQNPNFCADGLRYRLMWAFLDPDGNSQFSYTVQIKRSTTASWDDSANVVTITKPQTVPFYEIDLNSDDFKLAPDFSTYKFTLEYGGNSYDWRVKVVDNAVDPYKQESAWYEGPDIITPQYRFPEVDFTVDPNCVVNSVACGEGVCSTAETSCSLGSAIQFSGLANVFVECQASDSSSCQLSTKVKCGSSGMCEGCSNSAECHDKFGNEWECSDGTCSQNPSASCGTDDVCLAMDMSRCDTETGKCAACSDNSQCKKFNTPDTYYCKDSLCTRYSDDVRYVGPSGMVACSNDEACRQFNTGKDYVCNDGICEDYTARQWFFGEYSSSTVGSTLLNPQYTYTKPSVNSFMVKLQIKDYNGNICSISKNITFTGRKYPKWNEVSSGDDRQ